MAQLKTMTRSPNVIARGVIDKINGIREAICGYRSGNVHRRATSLQCGHYLDAFIQAARSAIESSDALRIAVKMDPDAVREAVAFASSFEAVTDELEATAKGMRHTIPVARAKAGDDARHTYDVALFVNC